MLSDTNNPLKGNIPNRPSHKCAYWTTTGPESKEAASPLPCVAGCRVTLACDLESSKQLQCLLVKRGQKVPDFSNTIKWKATLSSFIPTSYENQKKL